MRDVTKKQKEKMLPENKKHLAYKMLTKMYECIKNDIPFRAEIYNDGLLHWNTSMIAFQNSEENNCSEYIDADYFKEFLKEQSK